MAAYFIIMALQAGLGSGIGIGMLLGGYAGAHLAVKHGNKFIRNALLVLTFAMGIGVLFS